MDAVTVLARHQEAATTTAVAAPTRTLRVTVAYLLSEDGRKASLLSGGDGRALQQLAIEVPTTRLHLVGVDSNGVARLKLRPRYELNATHQVIRVDELPTYDAPPDLEQLFREAARNHELERAYEAERQSERVRRRDAGRERRLQVAQGFLNDTSQRALPHPAPSPKRCFVATEHGRVLFDVTKDDGVALDVPPEAHRRFRADLRARREHNLQERATQLALHEQKKRFVADWIAVHGTPDQQARAQAGALPMNEAIEAITDRVFAALGDRPVYVHDGAELIGELVRRRQDCAPTVVTPADLQVTSTNFEQMTAEQWAVVGEFRRILPDAAVTLRLHKIAWKRDARVSVHVFGVLVTQRLEPFMLRREYRLPEP